MSTPAPGPDGTALPEQLLVLRLAERAPLSMDLSPDQGRDLSAFTLSSADKASNPSYLSVFSEALTTPDQAWEIMGAKPKYTVAFRLLVSDVLQIRPDPDRKDLPTPKVAWFKAMQDVDGTLVPDLRPGAVGHAGILNLEGGGLSKFHRMSIRSQLADLAAKSFSFLPHYQPDLDEN